MDSRIPWIPTYDFGPGMFLSLHGEVDITRCGKYQHLANRTFQPDRNSYRYDYTTNPTCFGKKTATFIPWDPA